MTPKAKPRIIKGGAEQTAKFHVWLASVIDASPKNQNEIAREIGYDRPNIITMFKQGATKVPMTKIGPLARSLDVDPALMLRRAMQEYMPETWKAIAEIMGNIPTKNEREILNELRIMTKDKDPELKTSEQRRKLKAFADSLLA